MMALLPPLGTEAGAKQKGWDRGRFAVNPEVTLYYVYAVPIQEILNYFSIFLAFCSIHKKSKVRYLFYFVWYLHVRSLYHFVVKC